MMFTRYLGVTPIFSSAMASALGTRITKRVSTQTPPPWLLVKHLADRRSDVFLRLLLLHPARQLTVD